MSLRVEMVGATRAARVPSVPKTGVQKLLYHAPFEIANEPSDWHLVEQASQDFPRLLIVPRYAIVFRVRTFVVSMTLTGLLVLDMRHLTPQ